ncbi:hypothetical protein CPB84DRAFT_1810129, partial [Gymnopilus junonius]
MKSLERGKYDFTTVIIIGGGPAGCATALSFLKNSKHASCLIIDDANSSSFKAIWVGCSHYLHPSLPKQLASQVESANASAWSSPNFRRTSCNTETLFGHGLHLNRVEFEELLRDTVVKCASGSGSRLAKNSQGLWAVEMEENGQRTTISAKMDRSRIGSQMPVLAINDRQTLIEATADGWWYTSLISHNPPTRIVSSRRTAGFLDRLHDTTTHVSSVIAKCDYTIQEGYPCCTAAGSSHLEKTYAAIAFDPLSSQGMMTALEMGIY